MNKLILFIVIVLGLGFFLLFKFFWPASQEAAVTSDVRITVGDNSYNVLVANTPELQAQGLSGRESLAEGEGMIFVFGDTPSTQAFWMKGMNFPIDIIWIVNGEVIGFVENAQPTTDRFPEVYSSPKPVDLVLEVNAGVVARDGITAGDKVTVVGYTYNN